MYRRRENVQTQRKILARPNVLKMEKYRMYFPLLWTHKAFLLTSGQKHASNAAIVHNQHKLFHRNLDNDLIHGHRYTGGAAGFMRILGG